jgi:hemerythrin-like domain-containing protein
MATKQSSRKSSSRKSSTRSPGPGSRKSASKTPSRSRTADGTRRGGAVSRSSAARPPSRSVSRGRKPAGTSRGRAGKMDALKLLKEDHANVDQMFRKYDRMKEGDERKQALREQILEALRVHAQVEEELFYPRLNTLFEEGGKVKEVELIDEADVEHETVKWLIEQLEGGDQSDEGMTDARVTVLGEYVRHHVKEEEGQIFKAARKVDLDLEDLGRQIDARKRQLKGEAPEGGGGESAGDESMQINEPAQMASGRIAE